MKNLLMICAVLLLVACGKDDKSERQPAKADRTVIVYMSGENNLSDFLDHDLTELIQGSADMPENNHLVVFVDYANSAIPPYVAEIAGGKQNINTKFDKGEFYATDPELFYETLQWITSKYPANDYGLVLWGHADGWIIQQDSIEIGANSTLRRAYGRDTGDNTTSATGKWLNIPSMRMALETLGIKWKFIFSDCCNMQGIEVAYELKNVADYLIASPAEITGEGAPYDVLVKDFFVKNDQQMYQNICDNYHDQLDYVGGHLPISVIKTDQLDALAKATRQILPDVASYLADISNLKGSIYYYSYKKYNDDDRVMYDMNDVIRTAVGAETETYNNWHKAFNNAVVYSHMSTFWHANCVVFDFNVTEERFGGVSMFFPLKKYERANKNYNDFISQMAWFYAVGWADDAK